MAPKVDRNRSVEDPNLDRSQPVGRPATPPPGGEPATGTPSTGFTRSGGAFAKYTGTTGGVGRGGVFSPERNTLSIPGLPPGLTTAQLCDRLGPDELNLSVEKMNEAYQARLG
ncbi:MAG: hypothetical protein R3257_00485 [bacterium]|nr:hypothetical protein [bacterium]